jgi:hypothetical protein
MAGQPKQWYDQETRRTYLVGSNGLRYVDQSGKTTIIGGGYSSNAAEALRQHREDERRGRKHRQ